MRMILVAVDKRALQDQVSFGDSGGSLGFFRLSDVCLLMIAIFTGCISNLCSRTVHYIDLLTSGSYYGYPKNISGILWR